MDQTWQPATEVVTDTVTAGAAEALHGLLDAPGNPPVDGDPVPPLWHWLAFLPRVPQRELGPDGHPKRGTFLPPVALPRRMFAGGRFTFEREIAVGERLVRRSAVASVDEKEGRSGTLVFVTVRHEIGPEDGVPAVVEEQDLVYREPARLGGSPKDPTPSSDADKEWPWSWDLAVDPILLFRFSALTYNSHRIHYDRPYAVEVEGYPGLVVHGPLQAVALAELCRRSGPGRPLESFRFRALRPCFDDANLRLRGRNEGDSVHLVASAGAGPPTMQAEAVIAPA
jgi:3-methylfumaryl-CoA hydratase